VKIVPETWGKQSAAWWEFRRSVLLTKKRRGSLGWEGKSENAEGKEAKRSKVSKSRRSDTERPRNPRVNAGGTIKKKQQVSDREWRRPKGQRTSPTGCKAARYYYCGNINVQHSNECVTVIREIKKMRSTGGRNSLSPGGKSKTTGGPEVQSSAF